MSWRKILRDYMAEPNIPHKHHPHKTLDSFTDYLEQNYEAPEKMKGEDEEE